MSFPGGATGAQGIFLQFGRKIHGLKRRPGARRRMLTRRHTSSSTAGSIYLELVRSLFDTFGASVIMTLLFIVTAWLCISATSLLLPKLLAGLGSVIAVLRIGVVLVLRAWIGRRGLDEATAHRTERVFGAAYLSFAVVFGLFSATCMVACPIENQMLISALLVGYGAGVAAGISLRPWIGVPAMLLAVTPTIVMSAALGDRSHLSLAFLLIALTAGGIASMITRHRTAVEMIEMRHRFASLARLDPLTGLANRLGLEDQFLRAVGACGGRGVVLHCFDLDRFKPVNDVYGHAVGDLLLQAVAKRLSRLLRAGDLAVRLGGDEFAVLQINVGHTDEAELMARRIARAIAEPYTIDGHNIRIGASVGSASGREHGPDLARLLGSADKALYEIKHNGRSGQALAG